MKKNPVIPVDEFKTKAERCAFEIINFLIRHQMWQDTCIYVGTKRYTCYDGEHYQYGNTWDCVFREDDKRAEDYVEYTSDFLTMTFEGPFYDAINYSFSAKYSDKIMSEFADTCKKYGMYYEQGYAWSLSLHKL
jgi:hypothetical protein